MSNSDLEEVISNSVDDALLPDEPVVEASDASADLPDPTPEPTTSDSTPEPITELTASVEEPTTAEVASPGSKAPKDAVQDDFEKKFGIPAQSSSGRENRIPYSRVKKITERAIADAKTQTTKELETTHVPKVKFQELETTVKDYGDRLTKVAEFEQVMLNDAPRFLDMLSGIPAYAKIFKELTDAAAAAKSAPVAQPEVKVEDNDPMPQPDQELTDGSKVYSMEGLAALNAWNRAQARKEILGEVEKKYGALATDYDRYQRDQAALPKVQAQIADARTWPLFNENENEIVATLQKYPTASLERAYQHVVWPKLQAEQDKLKKEVEAKAGEVKVSREAIRAEVLAELKKAPKSTSVSLGSASKPGAQTSTTPRTMEEIIAESVRASGLK
jgi:hypothetical protein